MKRVAETLSLCSRAVVGLTGRYSSTETDRHPRTTRRKAEAISQCPGAAVDSTGYCLSIEYGLYFRMTMKRVAEVVSLCSRAVVGLTGRYSSTETDRHPRTTTRRKAEAISQCPGVVAADSAGRLPYCPMVRLGLAVLGPPVLRVVPWLSSLVVLESADGAEIDGELDDNPDPLDDMLLEPSPDEGTTNEVRPWFGTRCASDDRDVDDLSSLSSVVLDDLISI